MGQACNPVHLGWKGGVLMAWRKGHGSSAKGGSPRIEVLPADELPAANPANTVQPNRDAAGRFTRGNTEARIRRIRPGTGCLIGYAGLEDCSPEFKRFAQWGRRYASHRRAELARAHGGEISAGVGAIVESGALTMAASRFLQWKASQTGDTALFKESSQLAATARQHELAAWELAAREAKARPKAKPWWGDPVGTLPADEPEPEHESTPDESTPEVEP